MLFFIASCSLKQVPKSPEGKKEFLEETSRLEKVAQEHPDASLRAESHLRLAFLYVNYRNPQLNYTRALKEMETYRSLAPAKAQGDDFGNWLGVLREVDQLRKANKNLHDEAANLKETNHKLEKAIERLKRLDRQMEEKRRPIK
jgi:hypothetical protein